MSLSRMAVRVAKESNPSTLAHPMFAAEMAVYVAKELNPFTPAHPMFTAEPDHPILMAAFPRVKVEMMQVTMMALKHHMRAMTWRTYVLFLVIKLRSIAGLEVAFTA